MKAIIEFDLNNQDDLHSYNLCNNASNLHSCLHEFDKKLRSMYKYEGKDIAEEFRDLLHIYLNAHKITL
jgi:hypothetical protein